MRVLQHLEPMVFYPATDETLVQYQQQVLQKMASNQTAEQMKQDFLDVLEQYNSPLQIQLNDESCETGHWVDTDLRYSFVVELFVQDQYYALPISDIASITFKANQYLTDILWRRAEIHLKDGRQIACFVPSRYPIADAEHISDRLKFNRETFWHQFGDLSIAQGQKTWSNGTIDIGVLDIKSVNMIQSEEYE